MPAKNKLRGNRFERELVGVIREAGLEVKRARGSDGRSLGLAETVDLLIGGEIRVQAKVRKKLPKYLEVKEDEFDIVVFKEDRGKRLALIPLDKLLGLLRRE